jgi:hypothetical protein
MTTEDRTGTAARDTAAQGSPFALDGKVAIVTGSSRGIGRASAEAMARLGAKVVISSRKAEACEAVARDIRNNGGEASVIACNVSHKADVEALVAGTLRTSGRRHSRLQRRRQPGLRTAPGPDRRSVRQGDGYQRQKQPVALQHGDPRHGGAR